EAQNPSLPDTSPIFKQALNLQIEFRSEFLQNKAEDAGGLTPTKDDHEGMRKFRRKANASFQLGGVLQVLGVPELHVAPFGKAPPGGPVDHHKDGGGEVQEHQHP